MTLGVVLMVLGGATIIAASFAERYHTRRFLEHTRELRRLHETDDPETWREVQRFSEDRRVDLAVHVMAFGHPVGIVAFGIGVTLTFFW